MHFIGPEFIGALIRCKSLDAEFAKLAKFRKGFVAKFALFPTDSASRYFRVFAFAIVQADSVTSLPDPLP
jgi:hypothetical protein